MSDNEVSVWWCWQGDEPSAHGAARLCERAVRNVQPVLAAAAYGVRHTAADELAPLLNY
jgi:hypothetical protein